MANVQHIIVKNNTRKPVDLGSFIVPADTAVIAPAHMVKLNKTVNSLLRQKVITVTSPAKYKGTAAIPLSALEKTAAPVVAPVVIPEPVVAPVVTPEPVVIPEPVAAPVAEPVEHVIPQEEPMLEEPMVEEHPVDEFLTGDDSEENKPSRRVRKPPLKK